LRTKGAIRSSSSRQTKIEKGERKRSQYSRFGRLATAVTVNVTADPVSVSGYMRFRPPAQYAVFARRRGFEE